MSTERRFCQGCGTELKVNSPEGLCAKCLLAGGLEALVPSLDVTTMHTQDVEHSVPETPFTGTPIRYFGDYELVKEIARGGMGVVFKAKQVSLNRAVALKLISAGALATADLVQRFKAEAEAAAGLSHPNIVPIYEIGEHQGQHYFSMGLVEGMDLRRAIATRSSGLSTPQRAAQLVITTARAVQYAHQRGVLHRDIKPSNILLDLEGEPHLTDFGLAKLVEKESALTRTNAVLGTPAYMAPEQARGDTKEVTTVADVYGLGAVLYETLTGSPPFGGGTSLETIRQVLEKDPRPPSVLNRAVDRDLETICLKCLEKEPGSRYRSAGDLVADLERWLRDEPIMARPATRMERLWKWTRRRPAIAALAAGLVFAFFTGVIGVTFEWRRAEHQRLRAESTAQELRHNLYAADMGLAYQAWESDRVQRVREILKGIPDRELRGFEWHYMSKLSQPVEEMLSMGRPGMWGNALSPDDRLLVTGSFDGHMDVWDFERRQLLKTLHLPEATIYSMAISPDSETLANTMASSDTNANGLIYLWDLRSLTLKATLPGHTNMTTGVAFSPDNQFLASVTGLPYDQEAGQIFIWDLKSQKKRSELSGHNCALGFNLAFSPDGQRLATPHGDGAIRIWYLKTKGILQTLPTHQGVVFAVAFSPDGTQLASGGIDGAVCLWRLGEKPIIEVIGRHRGPVYSVAFSPDGKRLVSSGMDSTARLWNLKNHEEINRFRGHSDRVCTTHFTANGRRIVTGSVDGSARIWHAEEVNFSGCRVYPYPGSGAIALSPDGQWIIWDGHFHSVNAMTNLAAVSGGLWRFSPDGKQFVTQGSEPGFQVWSVNKGLPRPARTVITRTNVSGGFPAFSAEGRRVALVCGTTNLVVWSTDSWEEVGAVHDTEANINSHGFSSDGQWLAAAYDDGHTRLWHAHDLTQGPRLDGHRQAVRNLTFSHDAKWLATASMDGTVRLWDVASGQSHELRGDSGWMCSVAFSPDDRTLAAGTLNGEIKLWNVSSRREMLTLRGHATLVEVVEFSADGRLLISAGGQTLRVWSAP